ncbi:ABC transporter permease [Mobilitalea sibirica]|uniref:ABC transporter permease n=1 Tax=Mobilitalea sibirica TaxID=1462919 RepID=A0A8J7H188_9FIRM|nr:ABC transporter permease [Mobilitalea sibirica]MBH1940109.1 ABC transporter permease [Mobilitalea sibirica]
MSFSLYINRLKCHIRNKENMFWSYLFPIVLASCFFFAFNNLWTIDSFETIKIAYVSEMVETDPLKQALNEAKVSEGVSMFSITYSDKTKASTLLEEGEIEAYIVGGENPELFVKENGMNETIMKSFLDNYRSVSSTIGTILAYNPNAINEGLMQDLMQTDTFVEEQADMKKPDAMLVYFYALLAFNCIFAANWGLVEVINIQADQSTRGARVSVSPIHKMKLFLCNIAAAFTVHTGSILLLLFYMNNILKINFGDQFVLIIITCLIGSIAGIALGATVGILVRKKASVKDAILSAVIMAGGFLSGMMYADMKYIIATKLPILGFINPVNLVADTLYSLYYYDTNERFYLNMAILGLLTVLMGAVSYAGLRRKTYASI